jgi:hypothetical protein
VTQRIMPPADGTHGSISVNGRSYSVAIGGYVDVPDQDARIMSANGWTLSAAGLGGVGTTTLRPTNPTKGQNFHDTTLGYNIVWDGKNWRNPTSGATA